MGLKAQDLDIAVNDELLKDLLNNPIYKKEIRYNKLFLVADVEGRGCGFSLLIALVYITSFIT